VTEAARRVRWFRRADRLDELRDLVVRIDTALIVRDPGTVRSAEAYDGLRKQVVASAGERRRMSVFLTELAEALRKDEPMDSLSARAQEWLLQASIAVVDDPMICEVFDIVGEGDDTTPAVVIAPAYVDTITNTIVRRGIAEYVSSLPTPNDDTHEEIG
jgi:hypothetical protein